MDKNSPPEVPAGWAARWNDQYSTWFYVNLNTKQSQWERPVAPNPYPTPAPSSVNPSPSPAPVAAQAQAQPQTPTPTPGPGPTGAGSDLPAGWVSRWNDQYKTEFYVNTVTKQSQWERPTVPAVPVAAAAPSPYPAAATPPVAASPSVSVASPYAASPAASDVNQGMPNIASLSISGQASPQLQSTPSYTASPAPSDANQGMSNIASSISGQASPQPQSAPSVPGAPEVPAGWTARFNDQYQTWFFVNTYTKKSQWEKPTAPATPASDSQSVHTPQQQTPHQPPVNLANKPAPPVVNNPPGAPEVPAGWAARFNDQYKTWFFVNTFTKKSQWDKPTTPATPASESQSLHTPQHSVSSASRPTSPSTTNNPAGAPEVPTGWAARFNDQYKTWFYVNTFTKKSQWDKPTAPATPSLESQQPGTPGAVQPQQAQYQPEPQVQAQHQFQAQPQPQSQPQQQFQPEAQAQYQQASAPQSPQVPQESKPQVQAQAQPAPSPTPNHPAGAPQVPEGWAARFNDQYQTWFYVNLATKQSQWDKPTTPATPGPAAQPGMASGGVSPQQPQQQPQQPMQQQQPQQQQQAQQSYYSQQPHQPQQPQNHQPAPAANQQPGAPQVPQGWAARFNDQYQTWFYVNLHTKQSQWELPTTPAV